MLLYNLWLDDVELDGFYAIKLRPDLKIDQSLRQLICQTIRNNTSPRHVPAVIAQVDDIPRTFNGKIVEMAVRQIVHNQAVDNLSSIANPEALAFFKDRLELQE